MLMAQWFAIKFGSSFVRACRWLLKFLGRFISWTFILILRILRIRLIICRGHLFMLLLWKRFVWLLDESGIIIMWQSDNILIWFLFGNFLHLHIWATVKNKIIIKSGFTSFFFLKCTRATNVLMVEVFHIVNRLIETWIHNNQAFNFVLQSFVFVCDFIVSVFVICLSALWRLLVVGRELIKSCKNGNWGGRLELRHCLQWVLCLGALPLFECMILLLIKAKRCVASHRVATNFVKSILDVHDVWFDKIKLPRLLRTRLIIASYRMIPITTLIMV